LLRDDGSNSRLQLIVPPDKKSLWLKLNTLTLESVLDVRGKIVKRPETNINPHMSTGEVELEVESIECMVPSATQLPFYPSKTKHIDANEQLRMKHRYLDLRRPQMQNNIRFRSKLVADIRRYLTDNGFLDIETPTLFRRTPGGAREFVVPTHHRGKFYSLVQSPQQFKQLLMVGGFEKYFQIAKCYRDEGARPDRQPEFTQVDIELAFTDRSRVLDLIEGLVRHIWPSPESWPHLPPLPETPHSADRHFPVITYQEAMENYGTDKPDLRFGSPIIDLTEAMRHSALESFASKVPLEECVMKLVTITAAEDEGDDLPSISQLRNLEKLIRQSLPHLDKNDTLIVANFNMKSECEINSTMMKNFVPGFAHKVIHHGQRDGGSLTRSSVGFFVLAKRDLALNVAGRLRTSLAKLVKKDLFSKNDKFQFLWVQDFPMFLPKEVEEHSAGTVLKKSDASSCQIESAHHPFTQPHPEDIDLIRERPLEARSLHYDLVLNGWEVGGGSIRINDPELQREVLEDILKEDVGQLDHLLEAFSYGCPPHGGIALGLDRLCALLCGADSIRDVIAFPKGGEGKDPMSKAPASITQEDKQFYHIDIVEAEKQNAKDQDKS